MKITDAALTIPEAAFVSGLTVRSINHEIDEGIIRPESAAGARMVRGIDLPYLVAIRAVRVHIGQKLRRRLRDAIVEAARAQRTEARVDHLTVPLPAIERELADAREKLERIRREVESNPAVLAGEPVLNGSRIAARHIADLVRQGASREEIAEDFDLTLDQIEAAVGFANISPKRGRPTTSSAMSLKPKVEKVKTTDVPASR